MTLDIARDRLIYHGSYIKVEKPDLSLCAKGKDFGQGFYLTTDKDQAKNFIPTSVLKAIALGKIAPETRHGYVSRYRVKESISDIRSYLFPEANADWLRFVSYHRGKEKAKKVLLPLLNIAPTGFDVIAGKVADDNTNSTITAYLSGLFGDISAEETCADVVKRLMPEKLTNQYCFLTEAALNAIEYEGFDYYEF